jgi:hypothetical protein
LSTTTPLISGIDASYPVAGKNNDSEGFRSNFNLIKTAMLAIDSTLTTMVARVGALSATTVNVDAPLVTGTHVIAVEDITIGGTNVISTGDNFTTIITANGQSGAISLMPATFTVQATGALTDSPGDNFANRFGVSDASHITVGATYKLNTFHAGVTYTVAGVDTGNNIITAATTATVPLFTVGDSITFTNPFFAGMAQGASQTDLAVVNSSLTNTVASMTGDTFANVYANSSRYNAYGKRTVSSSAPSGGSNGDIWYQVS